MAGAGLEPIDHVVAVGGEDDVAAWGEERREEVEETGDLGGVEVGDEGADPDEVEGMGEGDGDWGDLGTEAGDVEVFHAEGEAIGFEVSGGDRGEGPCGAEDAEDAAVAAAEVEDARVGDVLEFRETAQDGVEGGEAGGEVVLRGGFDEHDVARGDGHADAWGDGGDVGDGAGDGIGEQEGGEGGGHFAGVGGIGFGRVTGAGGEGADGLAGFGERYFEGGALGFEGIDAFGLMAGEGGSAVETIKETHAGAGGEGEETGVEILMVRVPGSEIGLIVSGARGGGQ